MPHMAVGKQSGERWQLLGQVKSAVKSALPDSVLTHLQSWDHYWFGEDELRFVQRFCSSDKDALDVGANIGTYSYFMRKFSKRVYAYEPNPELSAALVTRFPDVTVRRAAVSEHRCELTLRIPVRNGRQYHELASVAQSFAKEASTIEYMVECVSIDDENHQNVGFIKIDVEQHELAVLRGAMDTVRRCRPVIMTEVSPLLYDSGLQDVFSFVTDESYEGWFRFNKRYYPLASYSREIHAREENWGGPMFMGNNLIFSPRETQLNLA